MIVALVVLFSLVIYLYLMHVGEENFQQQLEIQAESVVTQLESVMDMSDEVALQLAANRYLIDVFQEVSRYEGENNYFVEYPEKDYEVKQLMLSYILMKNSIDRITLMDPQRNLTFVGSAVNYGYLEKDCEDYKFLDRIEEHLGESDRGTYYELYPQDPFSVEKGSILTITRQIKDYVILPSETIGYIQVQVPVKNLGNIFKHFSDETSGYFVERETGDIIYSYQGAEEDLTKQENGQLRKEYPLELYGITFVVVQDRGELVNYAVTTLLWTLLFLIGIITTVIWGQKQLIERTTKPIVELCEFVENVKVDDALLGIPLVHEEENELKQLNVAFDGLIKNLHLAMEKNMNSQINELRTHMYALQSQMNPHFIHNVLFNITTMAEQKETGKINLVCKKLSEMIRYSTTFQDSYVEIQDEIDFLVNYLELMKIRYEDKFEYSISVLEAQLDVRVPKFIFQPIAENCFHHGLKNKEFPWHIEIMLYTHDGNWEIEIADNGNGFSEEEVERMKEEFRLLEEMPPSEVVSKLKIGGLGLKNVYARLYHAYEKQMVFSIETQPQYGCAIRLGGVMNDSSDGSGGRTTNTKNHM